MSPELDIKADLDNLSQVMEMVTDCAAGCGFREDDINRIQVATEEIFVNIVKHAYQDSGNCRISCRQEDDMVVLRFIDHGIPFNPTEVGEPDTESDVQDRPVGGMGIHLVREMMDEISYKRQNGRNVLTIGAAARSDGDGE